MSGASGVFLLILGVIVVWLAATGKWSAMMAVIRGQGNQAPRP